MTKAKNNSKSTPETPDIPAENQALEIINHIEEAEAAPDSSELTAVKIEPSTKSETSFGKNLWKVFVFLLKLSLIIVVVSSIGVGLYIGWPMVYDQYILPVENHTSQIAQLKKSQEQFEQQLNGSNSQITDIQAEQAQQARELVGIESRVETLATQISDQTKGLAALDEIQKSLQADKQTINSELDWQIKLLKSMELLSRARLFLYQSNYGLAKQDVITARETIATAKLSASGSRAPDLNEVLLRLDLCISRLPDYPVAASDDLDIAWQVLLGGIPQASALSETPTPENNSDLTAMPTSTPTATSTP